MIPSLVVVVIFVVVTPRPILLLPLGIEAVKIAISFVAAFKPAAIRSVFVSVPGVVILVIPVVDAMIIAVVVAIMVIVILKGSGEWDGQGGRQKGSCQELIPSMHFFSLFRLLVAFGRGGFQERATDSCMEAAKGMDVEPVAGPISPDSK
jgi:hypothetical protein